MLTAMRAPAQPAQEQTDWNKVLVAGASQPTADIARGQLDELKGKLIPAETARIGQVGVQVEPAGSRNSVCGLGDEVGGYVPSSKGGTIILCDGALTLLSDFGEIDVWPASILEHVDFATMASTGDLQLAYTTRVLTEIRRAREKDGRLPASFEYCNPYGFLLAIAEPKRACLRTNRQADRAQLVSYSDTSTMVSVLATSMASASPELKTMSGGQALQFLSELSRRARLNFVVAHELAHALCEKSHQDCDDEQVIDKIGMEILSRVGANRGSSGGFGYFPAVIQVVTFSSLFADKSINDMHISETDLKAAVLRRRAAAACEGLALFDSFNAAHPGMLEQAFSNAGNSSAGLAGIMPIVPQAIRVQLQLLCKIGKGF
ncbi:hypothetical protein [Flavisphingomonas formosensis]|uniref:hypothetical protein n=1 Tax=Flavisphingomonas formosensis TaxID=861534 RepID=UPI0012F737F9|nr:hypothetical protein [Sphingomonas formosensis]